MSLDKYTLRDGGNRRLAIAMCLLLWRSQIKASDSVCMHFSKNHTEGAVIVSVVSACTKIVDKDFVTHFINLCLHLKLQVYFLQRWRLETGSARIKGQNLNPNSQIFVFLDFILKCYV